MQLTKKNWKKTALYASTFLIAALIITIVSMATVMVQFFPTVTVAGKKINTVDLSEASDITIYKGTTAHPSANSGNPANQEFQIFRQLFEKSFKASFLTGSTEGATKQYKIDASSTNLSTVTQSNTYSIYYEFASENARIIYKSDSTPLKSSVGNQTQYAHGIMIAIPEGSGSFGEVKIYFATQQGNRSQLQYTMTTYANYKKLINALEEFHE